MTVPDTTHHTAAEDIPGIADDLCASLAQLCNARDLDGLVALYEPDGVVVERTGELSRGLAAIRAHLQALLAMNPTMTILGSTRVVHGDLALSSSWWRCEATAPDGTPVQMECRGSELFRRQPDGSWRIIVDNPWGVR